MAPAKYKFGDRVKCLATRFDTPGNEDSQGRKWSDIHMQQEKTKWVYGTVMRLLGGRRWAGNYKIKYDGDSRQETSHESHLEAAPPIGEEESDSDTASENEAPGEDASDSSSQDLDGGDEGGNASDEGRDPEGGMDNELNDMDQGESSGAEEDATAIPIGGHVEVGGNKWVRVAHMGDDARGDRPRSKMIMKKMVVNSHTTRSDFWKELFPVPLTEMLKVAQDNAARHRDRGEFEMDGLLAFLCCLYGGCQFAVGTDVWATQRKGMMPPPQLRRYSKF